MSKSKTLSRVATGGACFVLVSCMATGLLTASTPARASSVRAPDPAITVATFNVLSARSGVAWKPRRARVLELLRRADADVVLLQEADGRGSWYGVKPENVKTRGFPAAWLAKKSGLTLAPTNGYTMEGSTAVTRVARQGPHILYDHRRFTTVTGQCEQERGSGHSWVTLVDRRTKRLLRIANVHLVADKQPDSAQKRLDELKFVHARRVWCESAVLSYKPLMIWAGDFNATDDRRLKRVLRWNNVVDSVKIARERNNHRVNTYNGRRRAVTRKGIRIDQIWVPRGTQVHSWDQLVDIEDNKYVGRFGSDHNPVVARLTLPT